MKIENHSTQNQSSRGKWKPDMIVWHIADGTYNGTIGWEKNPASQISSHFVLGKSGEITQLVPLDKAAWTQGKMCNPTSSIVKSRNGINPNLYSISIECEGFWKDTKGKLSDAALKSAIELTKHIVAEVKRIYGVDIPIDRQHIIGHCEINPVTRPHCPGELFPYDSIIQGAKGAEQATQALCVNDMVLVNGKLWKSSCGGEQGQVKYVNYRGRITRINPKAPYPYLIDNGKGWAGLDNLTKI